MPGFLCALQELLLFKVSFGVLAAVSATCIFAGAGRDREARRLARVHPCAVHHGGDAGTAEAVGEVPRCAVVSANMQPNSLESACIGCVGH